MNHRSKAEVNIWGICRAKWYGTANAGTVKKLLIFGWKKEHDFFKIA